MFWPSLCKCTGEAVQTTSMWDAVCSAPLALPAFPASSSALRPNHLQPLQPLVVHVLVCHLSFVSPALCTERLLALLFSPASLSLTMILHKNPLPESPPWGPVAAPSLSQSCTLEVVFFVPSSSLGVLREETVSAISLDPWCLIYCLPLYRCYINVLLNE